MKNLTKVFVVWLLAVSLALPLGSLQVYALQTKGDEVSSLIKKLELGKPFHYENLTIVPIYYRQVSENKDYLTLDEAVKNGDVLITEVEGGRVPQVKVTNKSGHKIFLMSGEIITGARQNRLVGKDVLLGPYNKEVLVPVYCVEHGRWDEGSYEFGSEEMAAPPMFRKSAASGESQQVMWDSVAEYSMAMDVSSSTGNLGATYSDSRAKAKVNKYVNALKDIPRLGNDAVGVAVAVGGKIVTIDIFSNGRLFSDLWPKLLNSYAMGAIADYDREDDNKITQDEVKDILKQLYKLEYDRREGIALGEDLSASTDEIASAGLSYKGSVIHLSAFPNKDGKKPSPIIEEGGRIPVINED